MMYDRVCAIVCHLSRTVLTKDISQILHDSLKTIIFSCSENEARNFGEYYTTNEMRIYLSRSLQVDSSKGFCKISTYGTKTRRHLTPVVVAL